jgi:hypothetical protein
LNPELFAEIVERATGAYEEQTETKYPAANVAGALVSLQTFRDSLEAEPGTALEVSARLFKREEADDAS